ncbi:hypothetical protein Goari_004979 [Gossypium aridum]|uniref:Uncharacterized protein n=1 Tax=Gossypium aridum TaxID=34290 RepID=A0A7J8Y561_GOSAI|nr:hypothetical protein [Gossypium aridum]
MRRYPDAELRGAVDGQYVKVTGVKLLSPVAAFRWSHPTRGCPDVYMFPQNCTSIEDGVGNLQILSIVTSPGDVGILRNMLLIFTYQIFNLD